MLLCLVVAAVVSAAPPEEAEVPGLMGYPARFEAVLQPVVAQVNSGASQTMGTAGVLRLRLTPGAALRFTGFTHWMTRPSDAHQQSTEIVAQDLAAPDAVMLSNGALGGIELTPVSGELLAPTMLSTQYSVFVHGSLGVSGTRRELVSVSATGPLARRIAEAGTRPVGDVGVGVRFEIARGFSLELSAHNAVYSSRVESVDGCNLNDLTVIKAMTTAGLPAAGATVSGSCRSTSFTNAAEVTAARDLVSIASASLVMNTGVSIGLGTKF